MQRGGAYRRLLDDRADVYNHIHQRHLLKVKYQTTIFFLFSLVVLGQGYNVTNIVQSTCVRKNVLCAFLEWKATQNVCACVCIRRQKETCHFQSETWDLIHLTVKVFGIQWPSNVKLMMHPNKF